MIQQDRNFDLVISGINRGDNCGLHVIYSGTVGAAREAACKVRPLMKCGLRKSVPLVVAYFCSLVT